tara:strand:- start:420 stop:551 length:132 start_codon:yes stop_codon:yes gene_type:complete
MNFKKNECSDAENSLNDDSANDFNITIHLKEIEKTTSNKISKK